MQGSECIIATISDRSPPCKLLIRIPPCNWQPTITPHPLHWSHRVAELHGFLPESELDPTHRLHGWQNTDAGKHEKGFLHVKLKDCLTHLFILVIQSYICICCGFFFVLLLLITLPPKDTPDRLNLTESNPQLF